MTDPFARLGATITRLRWPVLVLWLVLVALAGGLLAPKAGSVLKAGAIIAPDSESAQAARILEQEFNASTANLAIVVYRSAEETVDNAGFREQVTIATERLSAVHGVRSVLTFFTTSDPTLVSRDRHTTVALISLTGSEGEVQEIVPVLREQLRDLSIEHYLTGLPALNYDIRVTSEEDLHRAEVFTIPLVVILLLFVFRTLIASAMPLILGACSVVTALAVIYVVGSRTDTSIYALNVTSMIGLGLGIDFSLIVINRFREELADGRAPAEAVVATMTTAGRSITYSGITVLLSMLLLTLLFDLMIVRSISLAVMLVALTALLSGLTLLPALLAILGHRIEWLRVIPSRKAQQSGRSGFWYRLSHAIMRRPWLWLAVTLGLLIALAVPVRELRLIGSTPGLLPASTESVRGVTVLNEAFGAHRLEPLQVVMRAGEVHGVWTPAFLEALQTLNAAAAADPRVESVSSLVTAMRDMGVPPERFKELTPEFFQGNSRLSAQVARFVNTSGQNDTAILTIFAKAGQYEQDHQALIHDLREKTVPGIPQLRRYDVNIGGSGALFSDFADALYSRFPLLVAGVMLLIFVVLMMFFQSVVLPLKAILMNLASVLATYGVLVLIFQQGWGASLLGFEELGRLGVVTPAILFVILFALSTDYEVFMLSRVKEYYHHTGNNEEAVAAGLENTARVITAAGLILIGTFGSFAVSRVIVLKEIGLGLAIGVLLDTTIVRVVLVPATMRLMGDANWWMPAWLKKIVPELREGPTPAPAPQPASPAAAKQPSRAVSVGLSLGALAAAADSPRWSDQAPAYTSIGELRPTGGSVGLDRIVLPQRRPFRIGRGTENELQLYDPRISRKHARIDYQGGNFALTDLNSTNGVYVNGRRIREPTVLCPGDIIEIGNMGTVTFVYEFRIISHPPASPTS